MTTTMQPTIDLTQRHTTTITLCSEHIERHRESRLMEAFGDAIAETGNCRDAFNLLSRLVNAEVGSMAERLVAAFARLDHVLHDDLVVRRIDGRVRMSVRAGSWLAYAMEDDTGWLVAAEQTVADRSTAKQEYSSYTVTIGDVRHDITADPDGWLDAGGYRVDEPVRCLEHGRVECSAPIFV